MRVHPRRQAFWDWAHWPITAKLVKLVLVQAVPMRYMYVHLQEVMHQNSYITHLIMSQYFVYNPHILEGCNHVTSALKRVKNKEGSVLIRRKVGVMDGYKPQDFPQET